VRSVRRRRYCGRASDHRTDRYAPVFIEAGADLVSVHQENSPAPGPIIRMIRAEGAQAGVVLNPSTPVYADDADLVDFVSHHERQSRRAAVHSNALNKIGRWMRSGGNEDCA
jgi:hypothetical protein